MRVAKPGRATAAALLFGTCCTTACIEAAPVPAQDGSANDVVVEAEASVIDAWVAHLDGSSPDIEAAPDAAPEADAGRPAADDAAEGGPDASADAVDAEVDATVEATVDATADASKDGGDTPADSASDVEATDCADAVAEVAESGCPEGGCVFTLFTGGNPSSLALDGDDLYFGDPDAGTLMRMPISGGTPGVIATGQSEMQAPGTRAGQIIVAGGRVFWADVTYVAALDTDGGVVPVTPRGGSLTGFAVDATGGNVYWLSSGGLAHTSVASGVTTVLSPLTAFAPPVYADTGLVLFPALPGCGDSAITVSLDGGITNLVAEIPGNVYTATVAGGIVAYARQTFGSCVCGSACPPPFSSEDQWADGLGAFGLAAPDAAVPVPPYPFSLGVSVGAVATDGASLYVGAIGAISKIPLGGGPVTTLAAAASPIAIALDATSLYWVDAGRGAIMKVTPR
jgi:hypothetical protein